MKLKPFILVLVPQCGWRCGAMFQQERALTADKTILIETGRLDPRELPSEHGGKE